VYRLSTICAFVLSGTNPPVTFGGQQLAAITLDSIEAFREMRRAKGLSAVSINHDLRLLRKMLNWAIRKGYLDRTPFKIGTEAAVALEREIPRHKRFPTPDIEDRLLAAAGFHLRGVITAMLDTACRPGEILSLQWRDVSMARQELTIRAEKEKTRRERIVPISARLLALLDMRRTDPAGREFPPDAYVFGDEVGQRMKSAQVREAWMTAATAAGLHDFQLRDLRHEAGSRFDEAGMPIAYIGTMLGHSNLSTTSRYLNINRRGLHIAMQNFDASRTPRPANPASDAIAQPLHTTDESSLAVVRGSRHTEPAKPLIS
jgi:integrase/recombinase XerD